MIADGTPQITAEAHGGHATQRLRDAENGDGKRQFHTEVQRTATGNGYGFATDVVTATAFGKHPG